MVLPRTHAPHTCPAITSHPCYLCVRRFHNHQNWIKVITSEQVDQLLGSLEEKHDNKGTLGGEAFKSDEFLEMYAILQAQEKPSITITESINDVRITGNTHKLQLFLGELNYTWRDGGYTPRDITNPVAQSIKDIKEIATDFGFNIDHVNPDTFYDISDAVATEPADDDPSDAVHS